MPDDKDKPAQPAKPKGQATKIRRFAAPDELDKRFGVTAMSDDDIQGLVQTEDVTDLMEAFGVEPREHISFPMQIIKKQHGEIWRMRIEPLDVHSCQGKAVQAHQWLFHLDYPNRQTSAA